jgi:hypothetical protein
VTALYCSHSSQQVQCRQVPLCNTEQQQAPLARASSRAALLLHIIALMLAARGGLKLPWSCEKACCKLMLAAAPYI